MFKQSIKAAVLLICASAATSVSALEGDGPNLWAANYASLLALNTGGCDQYFAVNKTAVEAVADEYFSAILQAEGVEGAKELMEYWIQTWAGELSESAKASGRAKENCDAVRNRLSPHHPQVFQ